MTSLTPKPIACPHCGLRLGLIAAEAIADSPPDPPPSERRPRISFERSEEGGLVAVRNEKKTPR